MSQKSKLILLFLIFFVVGVASFIFLFTADIAVLNPKGLIAQKQSSLLLISTLLMLIVVVPVLLLTFGIAWKYRSTNEKAKYTPNWDFSWLAESIWWAIPFAIIAILGVITWTACHELDPFKPIASEKKPLKIQVVALQWKWLFIYPEQKIATVNFVPFPEQTPIDFEISADAPMNSFWIPQLGGQVYSMAGMKTELHLIADAPGIYRGSSANISGKGFAGMTFQAKVTTQTEFEQWVDSVRQSGSALNENSYRELALPSEYNAEASYVLQQEDLFEQIVMKYMPMEEGKR